MTSTSTGIELSVQSERLPSPLVMIGGVEMRKGQQAWSLFSSHHQYVTWALQHSLEIEMLINCNFKELCLKRRFKTEHGAVSDCVNYSMWGFRFRGGRSSSCIAGDNTSCAQGKYGWFCNVRFICILLWSKASIRVAMYFDISGRNLAGEWGGLVSRQATRSGPIRMGRNHGPTKLGFQFGHRHLILGATRSSQNIFCGARRRKMRSRLSVLLNNKQVHCYPINKWKVKTLL